MEWLVDALAERGQSQASLARHLGIDKGAVTRIIQGKRAVKVEELDAIYEFLGLEGPKTEEETLAAIEQIAKASTHLATELRRPESKDALHKALIAKDNRALLLAGCVDIGDALLESAFHRLPKHSPSAFQAMLYGHWESLNLNFLAGLCVSLGRAPVGMLEVLSELQGHYDDARDGTLTTDEDFLEAFNSLAGISGLKASIIEEGRAMFVLSVTALATNIATNFNSSEIGKVALEWEVQRKRTTIR